ELRAIGSAVQRGRRAGVRAGGADQLVTGAEMSVKGRDVLVVDGLRGVPWRLPGRHGSACELVAKHVGVLRAGFQIVVGGDDVVPRTAVDHDQAVDAVEILCRAGEIKRIVPCTSKEVDWSWPQRGIGSRGRLDVKRVARLTPLDREAGEIVVVER